MALFTLLVFRHTNNRCLKNKKLVCYHHYPPLLFLYEHIFFTQKMPDMSAQGVGIEQCAITCRTRSRNPILSSEQNMKLKT